MSFLLQILLEVLRSEGLMMRVYGIIPLTICFRYLSTKNYFICLTMVIIDTSELLNRGRNQRKKKLVWTTLKLSNKSGKTQNNTQNMESSELCATSGV